MLKIKKGKQIIGVTAGAFKNFYKGAGWHVLGEQPATEEIVDKPEDKKVNEQVEDNKTDKENAAAEENEELEEDKTKEDEHEDVVKAILEMPASDMNNDQIKTAAKALGITRKRENGETKSYEEVRKEIAEAQSGK